MENRVAFIEKRNEFYKVEDYGDNKYRVVLLYQYDYENGGRDLASTPFLMEENKGYDLIVNPLDETLVKINDWLGNGIEKWEMKEYLDVAIEAKDWFGEAKEWSNVFELTFEQKYKKLQEIYFECESLNVGEWGAKEVLRRLEVFRSMRNLDDELAYRKFLFFVNSDSKGFEATLQLDDLKTLTYKVFDNEQVEFFIEDKMIVTSHFNNVETDFDKGNVLEELTKAIKNELLHDENAECDDMIKNLKSSKEGTKIYSYVLDKMYN